MSKRKLSTNAFIFCTMCIALNVVLGSFISKIVPFLYLDAAGTILGAVLFGPIAGILIGLVTNLITAISTNPLEAFFAIINMMIGLITGLIARRWKFTIPVAIVTGVILTIACSFVGSFIAQFVYGGLTGTSIDVIYLALKQSGVETFNAIFTTRILTNLADKVLCCVFVAIVIQHLPKSMLKGSSRL